MQTFTNGQRCLYSLIEFYAIHSKKTGGKNLIIVPPFSSKKSFVKQPPPSKKKNTNWLGIYEYTEYWRLDLSLHIQKICFQSLSVESNCYIFIIQVSSHLLSKILKNNWVWVERFYERKTNCIFCKYITILFIGR